jgi:hypothetical protein
MAAALASTLDAGVVYASGSLAAAFSSIASAVVDGDTSIDVSGSMASSFESVASAGPGALGVDVAGESSSTLVSVAQVRGPTFRMPQVPQTVASVGHEDRVAEVVSPLIE